ncbi:hypothetical protein H4R34_004228 [Dimargaris verticillata]|uniref:NDT80 domain-containing protein n=1 Tax=Dimargaris verticillata TaxID=2761393 RepID=A0A9W8B0L8_9FUNG|nr:hypothetical protein H4R34_004228 [Dimargaris verticillata]
MLHDNKWSSVPSTPAPATSTPGGLVQLGNGVHDQLIDGYGYSDPNANGSMPLQDQSMYMGSLPMRNEGMEPPRPATAIGTYGSPNRVDGSGAMRAPLPIPDRRYGINSSPYSVPFMGGHSYGSPFPGMRKRRADPLGFAVESGPFFGPTQQYHTLLAMDRTSKYTIRLNSKVDRGFFQADNDWTCYRRNYFQVSSVFNVTGPSGPLIEPEVPCIIEVDGRFHTVTQFTLGITAKVSNSDKKIELVQHTPKRDKGPQTIPESKPIRAGGNLSISSVGSNSTIVTYERIQFKTATANNGKRRAAQQYYVLQIELFAKCDDGQQFRVATTQSANLVVRGRSPGHYADNHHGPAFGGHHSRFSQPAAAFLGHPSSFDERYMSMNTPAAPYPSYSPFPSYHSSPMLMASHAGNGGAASHGSSTPAPSGLHNSAYLMHGPGDFSQQGSAGGYHDNGMAGHSSAYGNGDINGNGADGQNFSMGSNGLQQLMNPTSGSHASAYGYPDEFGYGPAPTGSEHSAAAGSGHPGQDYGYYGQQ